MSTASPILIFDGDCGICSTLARFAQARIPLQSGSIRPWQELDLAKFELTPEACDEALQFVAANGRIYSAQNAVAQLLLNSHIWWRPLGAFILIPGINALAGWIYRWVAANRHRLPGGTPACTMPAKPPPSSSDAES